MNIPEQFENPAFTLGIETFTAAELQTMEFPPVAWIVPDIVPEGLSLLAGKPKLGKSWLALDMACAVAMGSTVLGKACGPAPVLYLALEDNQRRLKKRLAHIHSRGAWPDNPHVGSTDSWCL